MSSSALFLIAGGVLFLLGLHALVVRHHLLLKVMSLNVMGSGVFMVLLATATRGGGGPPDPVPQALVLTGIVVTVGATAMALALLLRVQADSRKVELPEGASDRSSRD